MAGLRKPWLFANDQDYPGRFIALNRALGTARTAADPSDIKQARALVRELNRQYTERGSGFETAGARVNPHDRAWVLVSWYWDDRTPQIRIPQIFEGRGDANRVLRASTGHACYSTPQFMRLGEATRLKVAGMEG